MQRSLLNCPFYSIFSFPAFTIADLLPNSVSSWPSYYPDTDKNGKSYPMVCQPTQTIYFHPINSQHHKEHTDIYTQKDKTTLTSPISPQQWKSENHCVLPMNLSSGIRQVYCSLPCDKNSDDDEEGKKTPQKVTCTVISSSSTPRREACSRPSCPLLRTQTIRGQSWAQAQL